jgi:hypothetical protein
VSAPLRHVGSGMHIVPELAIRQVLLEGLVELAGDSFAQEELFGRADDLPMGTQEDWLTEMRAALVRMTSITAPDGIKVGVGYPSMEARFPYVSIVIEEGHEDESQATTGDSLGGDSRVVGTFDADAPESFQVEDRQVIGTEWDTTLQVGSWTEVPEESALLHAMVKAVVFKHKGRLYNAGVREVMLSETGFSPDERFIQRTGYVPVLRVSMRWTWRQTRRETVPHYFRLELPKKTN